MSRSRSNRKPPHLPPRTYWPETTAAHCHDWLSPDDVVRLALGAYYLVTGRFNKLPDDPAGERSEFNNGRHGLAERLAEVFAYKLESHGFKQGAPGFCSWGDDWLRKGQLESVIEAAIPAHNVSKTPVSILGPDIHRTQL